MKKLLLTFFLITVFALAVLAPVAIAKPTEIKSFRSSQGKYVYVGDYYYTVQKILKNPANKLHIKRYYGGDFIWVYDYKRSSYVYYLTFISGKLVRIEYDRRR